MKTKMSPLAGQPTDSGSLANVLKLVSGTTVLTTDDAQRMITKGLAPHRSGVT